MKKISLIIPVLNEQESIPLFYKAVREYKELNSYQVELVFVNDGSTDGTENILERLAEKDSLVKTLHFSRNFGKEPALFTGLEHCTGDAVIPIDVDLQDPIEIIPKMLDKWNPASKKEGSKIVLAKRQQRLDDSFAKRYTAELFYRIFNLTSDTKIEPNVGDFRLLDREVVEHLIRLPERNLFMKGILSWVGGDYSIIEYQRPSRIAGKTKFNFLKLLKLAIEGITSFSTAPLKLSMFFGFSMAFLSMIYGCGIIIDKIFNGNSVAGYPSLMTAILFLGGVQLISVGILGEYIGRIYIETKQRPRYILKNKKEKIND